MEISFGILTGKTNVDHIIQSIVSQNIASYEIIVVGPESFRTSYANVTLISSNELEKKKWVTKKKNKIIEHAIGNIVVIIKDYVILEGNWYQGLTNFSKNNEWDICMNALLNDTNTRCLDWVWEGSHKYGKGRNIDYNITDHENMYVPGAIVIAKKHVFTHCKFNEQLIGLQKGSDIIWSREALPLFSYKFNPHSKCTLIGSQGHRFKKCRRRCVCKKCIIFQYKETVHNYDPEKNNVILVGNGCNLLNYEYGPLIDKFDNVIRFNRFQLKNYEITMGTKTNTIFCNDTLFKKDVHRYMEYNDNASIIVYNVKATDFKNHYKKYFNIKDDLWYGLKRKVKYSKKQFFSTGFAAISFYLYVLDIKTITITNFDFQMVKNQIEYFNKKVKPTHDNHNFAQEKQLVETLVEQGRIVILDTPAVNQPIYYTPLHSMTFNKHKLPFNHCIITNIFSNSLFDSILQDFKNTKHFSKFGKYPHREARNIVSIDLLHYLNELKTLLIQNHVESLKLRNLPEEPEKYKWFQLLYCIDNVGYALPKHCDITKDWKRKCISLIIYINGKGSCTTLYDIEGNATNIPCIPNTGLSFVPVENETVHAVEKSDDIRHTIQLWLGKA